MLRKFFVGIIFEMDSYSKLRLGQVNHVDNVINGFMKRRIDHVWSLEDWFESFCPCCVKLIFSASDYDIALRFSTNRETGTGVSFDIGRKIRGNISISIPSRSFSFWNPLFTQKNVANCSLDKRKAHANSYIESWVNLLSINLIENFYLFIKALSSKRW